jgi:PQQ-like domain
MHFSLDDGSTHTEELLGTTAAAPAIAQNVPVMQAQPQGGLPISPRDQGRPLDPRRVQEQAQNMSYAGRLALPALLGNSQHNAQINQEVAQEDRDNERQNVPAQRRAPAPRPKEVFDTQSFTLIPDGDSYVAFASRMLQENVVEREAMKAAPTKSALDSSDLSAANEQKAVNEQLNDIQRQNGGDKVSEDLSTYQVALRRPGQNEPDWIGEIVGPPQFFPLTTVNVLAAGKTVMVFDKSNKRLWQDQTTYDVTGSEGQSESTEFGNGPCVENNNTLYVFDQAVLTAYDPTSGNVRWRIPSVGVVGLFFDDKGMVYVNTTTGNPDDIKYSRQIDINKDTQTVVMKVDPANGNILWRSSDGGFISYLSGKFIYAYRSYDAGDSDEQLMDATAGLTAPSYLKIIRINAANGHVMWEHDEDHGPVDVQFDRNIITLVLKKQVEVLKFFTF